ncbi:thiamine transport system ATP-binding protein [Oceanospirillum multiglobuliferum]|uniref:ABC transporter domain-containing protein n=1 Tax=Oceanospirillum multiglobuliferum TaxID=64969 RepID=A0A1T4R4W7_9GAMM|nr:ATP-binding cassette domain-containing protein [Oceanospirillum multiglobuliferum]OPX55230.1 hypothetical protein BTE48_09850 [Oceanospirillum multiglobuliferum]SKA11100.1 thiamine transport system ATP-binding protein [Oceanospirillum multiglobuliferum]
MSNSLSLSNIAAATAQGLVISQLEVYLEQYRLFYDLNIVEGECLAIQGRSGVGKTTLLQTIAGFERAKSGAIYWQGQNILQLAPHERPVSMLFQEHNLFEHLSVIKNLSLGFADVLPKEQLIKAAERLGVYGQLNKMPAELSGGQRQRIGLIRTLLRPEPIILLDEPFAELDSDTRQIAAEWTREVAQQQGKTLLVVTHQDEDVERLADRCLVLGD